VNGDVFVRFRDALGPAVSGADSTVTPADREAIVTAFGLCAETETPVAVRSAAAGSSARPPKDGVLISLDKFNAVDVQAASLLVRAGAGASVATLQQRVAAEGLAVTGLGKGPLPATVGALVATGALPRRALAGVEAVLPTGEFITFGGVLKDVVGYDVPSLLLGSMGRLGVITEVTFRLEPAAARTVTPAGAPGAAKLDPVIARAFDPLQLLQPPA
jgi:glycolate oxidase FAD binding subunit